MESSYLDVLNLPETELIKQNVKVEEIWNSHYRKTDLYLTYLNNIPFCLFRVNPCPPSDLGSLHVFYEGLYRKVGWVTWVNHQIDIDRVLSYGLARHTIATNQLIERFGKQ